MSKLPKNSNEYNIETSKLDVNENDFVNKPKPAPKKIEEAPTKAVFPEVKVLSSP
jgi:hypothetical protein